MKFSEYLGSINLNDVWPTVADRKDEETIQLILGDCYRFEKIFSAIPVSDKPLALLDIGTTPFTFFIKESYPHYRVHTLDLTDMAEESCREREILFTAYNIANLPLPFESNYFNTVLFTEVLEHLFMAPTTIMKEINRILAPGGKLIFTVPNFASLIKRIRLLFGISPMPDPDEQMKEGWVHGYGHPREYTMQECLTIFQRAGFKVTRKEFINAPLHFKKDFVTSVRKSSYYWVYWTIPSLRGKVYIEAVKTD